MINLMELLKGCPIKFDGVRENYSQYHSLHKKTAILFSSSSRRSHTGIHSAGHDLSLARPHAPGKVPARLHTPRRGSASPPAALPWKGTGLATNHPARSRFPWRGHVPTRPRASARPHLRRSRATGHVRPASRLCACQATHPWEAVCPLGRPARAGGGR